MLTAILFSQCRIGQSSTGQTTKVPKSADDTNLSSDEFIINAKVLRLNGDNVYSLRIYEVKEVGFGFSQEVNSGDKIDVMIPLPLPIDETVNLTIKYIETSVGGYYEVKTGAE